MLSLRTCLMAGVAGIGIAIAGATGASATPLVMTLDPSKTNLPAGGIIDPATAAFMTDGAVFGGGSLIDIAGTGPVVNSYQKGNINLTNFALGGGTSPSNVNVLGHYQIFGTYFISTTGTYSASTPGGPGNFFATSVNSVHVDLYAIPSTGTFGLYNAPTPTAPFTTPPGTLAGFGVTNESGQFLIGSADLINDGLSGASASTNGGPNASNVTFNGDLLFTPTAGTTPGTCTGTFPCGFFQAPLEVNFEVSVISGIPPASTAVSTVGIDTLISNLTTGGGALSFVAVPVPEPGSLSLLGIGLLGVAVARRRRRRLA
jgi:hypothetical protein